MTPRNNSSTTETFRRSNRYLHRPTHQRLSYRPYDCDANFRLITTGICPVNNNNNLKNVRIVGLYTFDAIP